MSTNIYVLKLQNNKYYIGKSFNPNKRFLEHLNGQGSTWTQKYEPIEIEKIIQNASDFDEDKYVKEYMNKYGINNVRGGSYVKELLDENEIFNLKKEIWGATNKCTQCGRANHFVKDCFAETDVFGDSIVNWCCDHCNKEFENKNDCLKHEYYCAIKTIKILKQSKTNNIQCYNCGRSGHYSTDCYSKNKFSSSSKNSCYRCGRSGHYSNDCYATKHSKGYYLDSDSD